MNKNVTLGLVVVVIAVIGIGYYLTRGSDRDQAQEPTAVEDVVPATEEVAEEGAEEAASATAAADATVEAASEEQPAAEETAAVSEESADEPVVEEAAAVSEESADEPVVEETAAVDPAAQRVAAADANAGEAFANQVCAGCHTFVDGGGTLVGPNLYGIVGDTKGSRDFEYSETLAGLGGTWSYADLDAFLTDPAAFAAGNSMPFPGIDAEEDRANVISYLRSNDGDPEALP